MYCYCLYCASYKCEELRKLFETRMPVTVIYPKQIQHTYSGGKMTDIARPILPGYVFLYAEEPLQSFRAIYREKGVYRLLAAPDGEYALTGSDRAFALSIYAKSGVFGKTPVYREGDKLVLEKGLFEGAEATILRVDRRNTRLQLMIQFARMSVKTWVEYEET